jgi:hypothetical protein
MEAEYFDVSTKTSTHQWVNVARGDSSNDGAMITTPDQGELAESVESTPMLSFMVYFNSPGKHYIWVRGSGDTNDSGVGNNDSVHVGLNGTVASTAYRIDQFPAEWTWSRHTPSHPVASLNVVDAGVNMVNFWMREDGFAIDKFVITSDPSFAPTGHGPEVTDGTDSYVPPASSNGGDGDMNPTNSDSVVTTPTNDDPVESEQTNADNVDRVQDDSVAIVPTVVATNSETTNSSDGIFGGSASTTALLALLALCLIKVGRFKTLRSI